MDIPATNTITSSQSKKFHPGFYVNLNGEKLNGYIWINKDRSGAFQFLNELNSTSSAIPYDSCKLISSKEGTFDVFLVTRSRTFINKSDYTIVNQDSSSTSSIPLKLLYRTSRFSLYQYENKEMQNFFVFDGNEIQELRIKYRYLTDWERSKYYLNLPKYQTDPQYRLQIITLMNYQLTKKQRDLIELTEYDAKSLTALLKALDT